MRRALIFFASRLVIVPKLAKFSPLSHARKLTKFSRHVRYGSQFIMHGSHATDSVPPAKLQK
uniref:Uncharacterized protein n=1 Tax=Anguilla anguilla TaxID=7936 RepID=A0A0E9P593_ANGAN